jgi:hypothetical protein
MSLRGISSAVHFIRRVGDGLADGKPCVIGNCQAGWAVTMLAAKASIGPHHDCPGARQRELKDLSQPENPARIEGCGVQSLSRGPSCVELRGTLISPASSARRFISQLTTKAFMVSSLVALPSEGVHDR